MDTMYLWIGKIVVCVMVWFVIGCAFLVVYHVLYSRYNGCWACGHGDIQDPIARWIAYGGSFHSEHPFEHQWRVPFAMPMLFWVGLVTFARQVARDRTRARATAQTTP